MPRNAIAVAITLFLVSAAAAQQPGHQMPMPTASAAPQPAPGACGSDEGKPDTPGSMSMGCGGCSMMRGGMMSSAPGGMSGMMAVAPTDSPRVIQMRGEMMKAMGEIMLEGGK